MGVEGVGWRGVREGSFSKSLLSGVSDVKESIVAEVPLQSEAEGVGPRESLEWTWRRLT